MTWLLASHPERQFTGRVIEIHRMAEVRGEWFVRGGITTHVTCSHAAEDWDPSR